MGVRTVLRRLRLSSNAQDLLPHDSFRPAPQCTFNILACLCSSPLRVHLPRLPSYHRLAISYMIFSNLLSLRAARLPFGPLSWRSPEEGRGGRFVLEWVAAGLGRRRR